MPAEVNNVITYANFGDYRLRGFGVARVELWPFPLTCFVAITLTLSHYRVLLLFNTATATRV